MSNAFHAARVFVGNIPWTVSNTELRSFFTKFGPVVSSWVPFDKTTGMNKGYGFVTFSSPDAYDSAIQGGVQVLEGNTLNIQPSGDNNRAESGSKQQ